MLELFSVTANVLMERLAERAKYKLLIRFGMNSRARDDGEALSD
jgi:hypothetical protein